MREKKNKLYGVLPSNDALKLLETVAHTYAIKILRRSGTVQWHNN